MAVRWLAASAARNSATRCVAQPRAIRPHAAQRKNEIAAFVETVGLDSYLGCLHQVDYGRHSLALDLVEPFRAQLVDRLILTVLDRRQFTQEDFEKGEGGGLYLRNEAARRFLAEYERWMLHGPPSGKQEGFRGAVREEVQSYAAALRDSDPSVYKPYLLQGDKGDGAEGER